MECPICFKGYNANVRKPRTFPCGHTFCEHCKDQLLSEECPTCRAPFTSAPPNYALLEIIEQMGVSVNAAAAFASAAAVSVSEAPPAVPAVLSPMECSEEAIKWFRFVVDISGSMGWANADNIVYKDGRKLLQLTNMEIMMRALKLFISQLYHEIQRQHISPSFVTICVGNHEAKTHLELTKLDGTPSSYAAIIRSIDMLRASGATDMQPWIENTLQTNDEIINTIQMGYPEVEVEMETIIFTDGQNGGTLGGQQIQKGPDVLRWLEAQRIPESFFESNNVRVLGFGMNTVTDCETLAKMAGLLRGQYLTIPNLAEFLGIFACMCSNIISKMKGGVCPSSEEKERFCNRFIDLVRHAQHRTERYHHFNFRVNVLLALKSEFPSFMTTEMCERDMQQLCEACLNSGNYARWGKQYMLSTISAWVNRQPQNIRDKGCESLFSGPNYEEIKDECFKRYAEMYPDPVNQSIGNSEANGVTCVLPETIVQMANGQSKMAESVQKGDLVQVYNKDTATFGNAKIVCVVYSKASFSEPVIQLDPTDEYSLITKWHPVVDTQSLKSLFPCKSKTSVQLEAGTTKRINFVLDDGHLLVIGSSKKYAMFTLGHNYMNDSVASHPFFGTDKVLQSLQNQKGYEVGEVFVKGGNRCPTTKLINEFVY